MIQAAWLDTGVQTAGSRTAQAWCRKALWNPRRTGSLPRKLKAMLETPPLILQPGHSRLISRVALPNGKAHSEPDSHMIPVLAEANTRTAKVTRCHRFNMRIPQPAWATDADVARGDLPDEVYGVVVVLRQAGPYGEDVGIENDVLRVEADLLHQDFERPHADANLRDKATVFSRSTGRRQYAEHFKEMRVSCKARHTAVPSSSGRSVPIREAGTGMQLVLSDGQQPRAQLLICSPGQACTFSSKEAAWPCSSKAITTTAAPCRFTILAWCLHRHRPTALEGA